VERPGGRNVCLFSEGSFHQIHDSLATPGRERWATFNAEYAAIFGHDYQAPAYRTLYFGEAREKAVSFASQSNSKTGQ